MPNYGTGLVGIIALLLTIWGVVSILQSGGDTGTRIIWLLVVILLPIVGFLIWYLMGPGNKTIRGRAPR